MKKCFRLSTAFLLITISLSAQAQDIVDATTLTGKYMCGYQGWFQCPGDGSGGGWFHWFHGQDPSYSGLKCDVFPDLTEFSPNELYPTNMKYPDGSTVKLFSSYRINTQLMHFRWMKEYNIDGVWIQRFGPRHVGWNDFTNKVLLNCKQAAETYGRVFTVMYDISGANNSTLFNDMTNDWKYLVDTFKITASSRYLNHKGKPVVSIWGFGFDDRSITTSVATSLVKWFQTDAAAKYQATVMVGVVSNGANHWRTLPEPWASTIRTADIISPWFVGSFGDIGGADNFKTNRIVPDIAECTRLGKEYLPVVFPGFSWANMTANPSMRNQIPRKGGTFYWEQIYNAVSSGATMLYGAMFDEVDEGTAILKACPKKSLAPADWWLTLDADGYNLPSDWYLRMACYANKMLKKQIPLSKTMPIDPAKPDPNWVSVRHEPTMYSPVQKITIQNNTVWIAQAPKGNVAVTLDNMNGRTISVFDGINTGGSMRIPLTTQRHISNGVYLLRVKTGNATIAAQVMVLSR
jgi:hypothetical protein